MTPELIMGPPLAVGFALAVFAQRRGWSPPLWVALCAGAVLRVLAMLLAPQMAVQPYDFEHDFRDAANAVLDGQNPTMHLREGGWHFLPLLAYVLAGQQELGETLGLSWAVAGRIVPVVADLALIPLISRLAAERGALRGFQYACLPVGVLVSGLHGQFPPITLLFGVAALLAARRGHVQLAGLLIGLSVSCTHWSLLLVPGVVLAVPGLRRRVTVLVWTAMAPLAMLASSSLFLDTAVSELPALVRAIMSTRPVVGDWGWTAVATGGEQIVSPVFGRVGLVILAAALLAALWWWRWAEPELLTLALLLVFLIVTYRLGAQYLLWPLPYLLARPPRGAWSAITLTSLWVVAGYLHLLYFLTGMEWATAHRVWVFSSLAVIAAMVYALPWRERGLPATGPAAGAQGLSDGHEPAVNGRR
ncbi:hypothetical protein FE391_17375 [Nonomuraea sp. KC401]|uniref:hypothetical protein n=1 Tax=unclassified Nonomuraea TaxID=2593643 RepID=UPI0010FE1EB4|nr:MULTISPECIES: hypothetical protein [unclassified Nonomuraea]NBE95350.1 hypothetical protein [Nonomuraea sp. K271]TLF72165.1 hypothetical protein FE391_17375 [Nonomuraea sp. KC401]